MLQLPPSILTSSNSHWNRGSQSFSILLHGRISFIGSPIGLLPPPMAEAMRDIFLTSPRPVLLWSDLSRRCESYIFNVIESMTNGDHPTSITRRWLEFAGKRVSDREHLRAETTTTHISKYTGTSYAAIYGRCLAPRAGGPSVRLYETPAKTTAALATQRVIDWSHKLAKNPLLTLYNAMEQRGKNDFSDVAVENAIQDLKKIRVKQFDNQSLAQLSPVDRENNNNNNFFEAGETNTTTNNNDDGLDDNGNLEPSFDGTKVDWKSRMNEGNGWKNDWIKI